MESSSSQEVCLSREISKRNIVNGCLLLLLRAPLCRRASYFLGVSRLLRAPQCNLIFYYLSLHPPALLEAAKTREARRLRRERMMLQKHTQHAPRAPCCRLCSDVWPAALADGVISCSICVVRGERKVLFSLELKRRLSCLTCLKIVKAELKLPVHWKINSMYVY
jgi:hypothetical protein